MFLSLALILILGLLAGQLCKKLSIPSLLGMLVVGILIGPYAFNLIDSSILNISEEIRKIALIIILIRAGLTLNLSDLKKVGRPSILICFIPALLEIGAVTLLAPLFFEISTIDAMIMGCVIAAVSPAVIVPKMINLIENGYGKEKSIPQMILAGATVDDIIVIALFSSLLNVSTQGNINPLPLIQIPFTIIIGVLVGFLSGILLSKLLKKINIRDTAKVIIILCISFLFVSFEDNFKNFIPFSSLIATMFICIALNRKRPKVSKRLSVKYNKLWVVAQVMLFVLVGASVDINYAFSSGIGAIILILCVLIFRMLGVLICLIKTNLNLKERLFCVIAYIPKATVQAAIGGIPLAMGLTSGNIILTVAVLSILITAPLGAFLIDKFYKKLLS